MTEVLETQEVAQKPKLDVLQKEKMRKEAIQNSKYQAQFMTEQNKLMRLQNERMKLDIENQELSARSWKAWHDKMFYSMACEKLEPEYKEYQTRVQERMKEEKLKQEEEEKKGIIPESEELTLDSLQEIPNRE